MEQTTHIIHQSLHRHNLVLGGERDLVMGSALLALLVGVGGMTLISGGMALTFWLFTLFVLRRMAKVDPMLSRVWLRHVKQQDFYSSRSSRWRMVR